MKKSPSINQYYQAKTWTATGDTPKHACKLLEEQLRARLDLSYCVVLGEIDSSGSVLSPRSRQVSRGIICRVGPSDRVYEYHGTLSKTVSENGRLDWSVTVLI